MSKLIPYETRSVEVCPGEEQAGKLTAVLRIRDEKARMKVTPLAVAPLAQEDRRMACDGTRTTTALFSTLKGAARPITTASAPPHPRNIPQESSNGRAVESWSTEQQLRLRVEETCLARAQADSKRLDSVGSARPLYVPLH